MKKYTYPRGIFYDVKSWSPEKRLDVAKGLFQETLPSLVEQYRDLPDSWIPHSWVQWMLYLIAMEQGQTTLDLEMEEVD